jgi:hypothetical protein
MNRIEDIGMSTDIIEWLAEQQAVSLVCPRAAEPKAARSSTRSSRPELHHENVGKSNKPTHVLLIAKAFAQQPDFPNPACASV